MKKFEITAGESVVAEVKMLFRLFETTFDCTSDAISFIKKERNELKDCPTRWSIQGDYIVFTFCSIGRPVMQEIQ